VPGCEEDKRNTSGLHVGQPFGKAKNIAARYGHVLCIAAVAILSEDPIGATELIVGGEAGRAESAGDPRCHQNGLPGSEVHCDGSHFFNFTSDFATRNQWQGKSMSFDTVTDPKIQVIETARTDSNEHLVGAHLRPGQLAPLQRLGTTMVTDSVGEHREIVAATRGSPDRE
jgi:hypothetical protein